MELQLNKLEPGQKAIVVTVKGSGTIRRRIMDMGIVRGSKIKVIRRAPLGDPVEFEIRDYNLTLRKKEAECIYVSLEEKQ
ncbi:MAG: ferrous iron transport protein A [Candidatus Bathyarchaeota archaeon]|nr:ferrous iron transport protein A [Candidatus Bathyarchaeum tardum]WGM89389.1 MAG: ferrous iron transport protein A [Candidatus Bathyarchaeum tardum]WNZ28331.1 MAG: ferrous iron transport protein A [Candidatus Bathyarchaeota archaeon]